MSKTPELRERCAEILAWKSSGILEGNALRAYAEKLRGKFGGVFDAGEALSFAEKETARELMEMAAAAVPIDVDALAQEIRRVDGNHDKGAGALAESLMPFLTAALQSAADTPPSPLSTHVAEARAIIGYLLERHHITPCLPAESVGVMQRFMAETEDRL